MADHSITPLVERLCLEFNLNARDIDYIQKAQMLYVFKILSRNLATADAERIAEEILHMRYRLRTGGRSRSLYALFRYLQAREMTNSGRYDLDTLSPPVTRFYYDN